MIWNCREKLLHKKRMKNINMLQKFLFLTKKNQKKMGDFDYESDTNPELFEKLTLLLDNPSDNCIPYFRFGSEETFLNEFGESELKTLNFLAIKERFDDLLERNIGKEYPEYEEEEKKKMKTFYELIVYKVIEYTFNLNLCSQYIDFGMDAIVKDPDIPFDEMTKTFLNAEHLALKFHGLFTSIIGRINYLNTNHCVFPHNLQIPGEANYRKYISINAGLNESKFKEESKKKIEVKFLQYTHVTPKNPEFENYQWYCTFKNNCVDVIYDLIFESRNFHLSPDVRENLNDTFFNLMEHKSMTETLMIGFRFDGPRLYWTITPNDSFGVYKKAKVEELIYNNKVTEKEQIPLLLNFIQMLKQEISFLNQEIVHLNNEIIEK
jgi:hypothetical protein